MFSWLFPDKTQKKSPVIFTKVGHLSVETHRVNSEGLVVSSLLTTERGLPTFRLKLNIYNLEKLFLYKRAIANSLDEFGNIAAFNQLALELKSLKADIADGFEYKLEVFLVENKSSQVAWSINYATSLSSTEVLSRVIRRLGAIKYVPLNYRSSDWYGWVLRQNWKLLFLEAIEETSIKVERGTVQAVLNAYLETSTLIKKIKFTVNGSISVKEMQQDLNAYWRKHPEIGSEAPQSSQREFVLPRLNYRDIVRIALEEHWHYSGKDK